MKRVFLIVLIHGLCITALFAGKNAIQLINRNSGVSYIVKPGDKIVVFTQKEEFYVGRYSICNDSLLIIDKSDTVSIHSIKEFKARPKATLVLGAIIKIACGVYCVMSFSSKPESTPFPRIAVVGIIGTAGLWVHSLCRSFLIEDWEIQSVELKKGDDVY